MGEKAEAYGEDISGSLLQRGESSTVYNSYYMPIIEYGRPATPLSFKECDVLNYSHSHNPPCAPHRRTDEPKRPESHRPKECARARVRCLNTEPNYYYCPITLVMS
jgi:hypothetical protein